MLTTLLVVLLILMLIGAFPAWPHAANWGYWPSTLIVVILVLVLVLGYR